MPGVAKRSKIYPQHSCCPSSVMKTILTSRLWKTQSTTRPSYIIHTNYGGLYNVRLAYVYRHCISFNYIPFQCRTSLVIFRYTTSLRFCKNINRCTAQCLPYTGNQVHAFTLFSITSKTGIANSIQKLKASLKLKVTSRSLDIQVIKVWLHSFANKL